MKLPILSLIALALAGSVAAVPAAAQDRVVEQKTVVHTTSYGRARHRPRRICTTRRVNHHRVTRCRWR